VNRGDPGVPGEVRIVERQDTRHAMEVHRGHEAGVMRLDSQNAVGDYEGTPGIEQAWRIRQEREVREQPCCFGLGLRRREPKSVGAGGPRGHYPELVQVLRHDNDRSAPGQQTTDSANGGRVHRMVRLTGTQEDIRVGQDTIQRVCP